MLETTGWMGPPTPRTFSGHGCSAEGPSKPPEKHPTPEGGGSQAAFLSAGTCWWGNMGLGEKRQRRDSPPPTAPTARGCPGIPGQIPQRRAQGPAGLGLPWEIRVTAARAGARWGLAGAAQICLSYSPLPQRREQQGRGEGIADPRGTAATPTPIQGSPQTDGTVSSRLPRRGVMAPQPQHLPPHPGFFPNLGTPETTHRTQTRDAAPGTPQASPPTNPARIPPPTPTGAQPRSPAGREEAAAAPAAN